MVNLTPQKSPIKSCISHIKPFQAGEESTCCRTEKLPLSNIANEKTGNEPALLFGFFNKSTNKGSREIYGKCGEVALDFLYYLGKEGGGGWVAWLTNRRREGLLDARNQ